MTVEGPDCLSASTSRGQHIENVKRKDSSMDIDIKKESVSGDMMKMSISAKSGNAKGVNRGRVPSSSPYKPEKWMLPDRSEDRLTQLNLAIVSHPSKFLLGTQMHFLIVFVYVQPLLIFYFIPSKF